MTPASSRRQSLIRILIVQCCGVLALAQDAPPAAPVAKPPTPAALDPRLDEILTRLESQKVASLAAEVSWQQQYVIDLPEDATTKIGRIWYQDVKPVARFVIHFTRSIASGRRDTLDERHMFDGEWYTEMQSRSKSFVRQQVRRATDPGDPYRIGQGVFPLPFGQKKEDIVREFVAALVDPLPADPPDTDHVRLTPRPGTRIGEVYGQMDFFVSRRGDLAGLPIRVRVAKKDGAGKVNATITITFDDVRLNTGVEDSVFDLQPPDGYQVTVEPLPPPATAPAAGVATTTVAAPERAGEGK